MPGWKLPAKRTYDLAQSGLEYDPFALIDNLRLRAFGEFDDIAALRCIALPRAEAQPGVHAGVAGLILHHIEQVKKIIPIAVVLQAAKSLRKQLEDRKDLHRNSLVCGMDTPGLPKLIYSASYHLPFLR